MNSPKGTNVLPKQLVGLPWDSEHFGFPVGRIPDAELDDSALRDRLATARRAGMVLVYWAARPDRPVAEDLLRGFSGLLVDRKATFVTRLEDRPAGTEQGEAVPIREYPQGPATEALVALGIAAGEYSRFHLDPNIPQEKFELLYAAWVRRSAMHELADAVFVARNRAEEPIGLITVAEVEGRGSIGLLAVHERARGQGIASALVRRAHAWMLGRGLNESTVVTQLDNSPGCRLYERNGYRLESVQHVYHFWPQHPLDERT